MKESDNEEVIEISDEVFFEKVVKNFDCYVALAETEVGETSKSHKFVSYKTCSRKGHEIIVALVQGVLCDKHPKVIKSNFPNYISLMISSEYLNASDLLEGVSKVVQLMPELQMDCPLIYRLIFDNLIVPLEKMIDIKDIRWGEGQQVKDEDSDDYIIQDTDSQFKLAALLL